MIVYKTTVHRALGLLHRHLDCRGDEKEEEEALFDLNSYLGEEDLLSEFRWMLEDCLSQGVSGEQVRKRLLRHGFKFSDVGLLRAFGRLTGDSSVLPRSVSAELLMSKVGREALAASEGAQFDGNSQFRGWLRENHQMSCSDRALRKFFAYAYELRQRPELRFLGEGEVGEDVASFARRQWQDRVPVQQALHRLRQEEGVVMSYGSMWHQYHLNIQQISSGAGGPAGIDPREGMECLDEEGLRGLGGGFWELVCSGGTALCLKARLEQGLGFTCRIRDLLSVLRGSPEAEAVVVQELDLAGVVAYAEVLWEWHVLQCLSQRVCQSRLRSEYGVECSQRNIGRLIARLLSERGEVFSSVEELDRFDLVLNVYIGLGMGSAQELVGVLRDEFNCRCLLIGFGGY